MAKIKGEENMHSRSIASLAGALLVRGYQIFFSLVLNNSLGSGGGCRFYPSCSAYALLALQQHGFFKGLLLTSWRLLRCNPWCCGGVDLVPGEKKNYG